MQRIKKKSLFDDDASFKLDDSFKSFQTLIDILDNCIFAETYR